MLPPRKSKSSRAYFFTVDDSVRGSSLLSTTKKEKVTRETYAPVVESNPELVLSTGGFLLNSGNGKIILSS